MEAVGNDRELALRRLDEKHEAAYQAWSEGLMPDDLYNLRCQQIREQRARIEADLEFFREAEQGSAA